VVDSASGEPTAEKPPPSGDGAQPRGSNGEAAPADVTPQDQDAPTAPPPEQEPAVPGLKPVEPEPSLEPIEPAPPVEAIEPAPSVEPIEPIEPAPPVEAKRDQPPEEPPKPPATKAAPKPSPAPAPVLSPGAIALSAAARGLACLGGAGASLAMAFWELRLGDGLTAYVRSNDVDGDVRQTIVRHIEVGVLVPVALAIFYLLLRRKALHPACMRLEAIGWRLSPFILSAFIPLLFRWDMWVGKDINFLVLAAIIAFTAQKLFYRSFSAPKVLYGTLAEKWKSFRDRVAPIAQSASKWLPWVVVVALFVGYAAYFSFYTVQNHRNLRTASYDMAIEDNVVYNALRGKLMKASPAFGPNGDSHIGYHATWFAYVVALFYALYQHPETLLVFQAVLMGAAVIPLFLFARTRLGPWPAMLLAALYVLYAPLHGANLYDFHYPPLGIGFIFWTVFLIDTGRYKWAAVTILFACSIREDMGLALFASGCYFLLYKRKPSAGLTLAVVGALYFVAMKMFFMPHMRNGQESFAWFYQDLIPKTGQNKGFSGILMTIIGNPGYTLDTLLKSKKFIYLLQVLVPFCFLPARRALGFLMAVPALLMTLLSNRDASYEISFQYTSHWTIAMFIASIAILTMEREPKEPGDTLGKARVASWLAAMTLAMLATSYQHGAILQKNTARGGFLKFKFERTPEDIARYENVHSLIGMIPPDAKVAGGEHVLPQLSNREDAYTIRSVGISDAEYILVTLPLRGKDLDRVRPMLQKGRFGVVARAGEFVLMKKGHPTDLNNEVIGSLTTAAPKPKPARGAPKDAPKDDEDEGERPLPPP
jgi:uncharacterized membrane protein